VDFPRAAVRLGGRVSRQRRASASAFLPFSFFKKKRKRKKKNRDLLSTSIVATMCLKVRPKSLPAQMSEFIHNTRRFDGDSCVAPITGNRRCTVAGVNQLRKLLASNHPMTQLYLCNFFLVLEFNFVNRVLISIFFKKKVKFITFDPAYVFVFSLQKLTRGMFFHAILNKSRARRFNLRPSEFVPLIWVSCS